MSINFVKREEMSRKDKFREIRRTLEKFGDIKRILCSILMNKDLAYLVRNTDLQKKFKLQIMIKIHPELNEIEDIMDILPSEIYVCFILLKTREQSGH